MGRASTSLVVTNFRKSSVWFVTHTNQAKVCQGDSKSPPVILKESLGCNTREILSE